VEQVVFWRGCTPRGASKKEWSNWEGIEPLVGESRQREIYCFEGDKGMAESSDLTRDTKSEREGSEPKIDKGSRI